MAKASELFARALNEQMNKNYDEAIKLYTESLKIVPDNIILLNNRGNLYLNKYQKNKEEKYFDKSLDDYNNILSDSKEENKS